jgi:hypothetical protein
VTEHRFQVLGPSSLRAVGVDSSLGVGAIPLQQIFDQIGNGDPLDLGRSQHSLFGFEQLSLEKLLGVLL